MLPKYASYAWQSKKENESHCGSISGLHWEQYTTTYELRKPYE